MKNTQAILDSQCYTYLVTSLNNMKQPIDSLREEKVALVRSYLYGEIDISITKTVKDEWLRIRDSEKLNTHHVFSDLIDTVYPHNSNLNKLIKSRSKIFIKYHSGFNDCIILAEAEVMGFDVLVSFDNDLIKRLSDVSKIKIQKPHELWATLNVKKGSRPKTEPKSKNPMSEKAWWVW